MRKLLLKVAHKIIRHFGNSKIDTLNKDNAILIDVFKSNFPKRILLSYIKQPFLEEIKYHHTNYLECFTAAQIFNELGYCVDVVDLFNDETTIDYDKYEIVYGLGIPLEKSFYCANPERIIKILYATGCNPFYSYETSLQQVQNFYLTKGKLIPQSSRVLDFFWTCSYFLSNNIIALGNQFVADTYININNAVKCKAVAAFYFDVYDIDVETKNFDIAKKHFLWFGSGGLLHKGLDLLIDIFSNREDIQLHICGASKSETKFWEFYQPIIDKCNNIIDHNFVDIKSKAFEELMNSCAFCIYPTASEGGSPALLNVMANGGLIPIASRACGIDINNLGLVFDNLNKTEIEMYIDKALDLDKLELLEKSKFVKKSIKERYTFAIYKSNIKSAIKEAIDSSKLDLN